MSDPDEHGQSFGRRLWAAVSEYVGLLAVLAALLIIFGLLARNFLTLGNLTMIANQNPYTIVLAVGMTFVLIVGGIDLSVGSVLALSIAVMGLVLTEMKGPLALPVGLLACLAVGTLCGAANGALTIAWRLPSFIVTLGMLEMARGGAYFVTQMRTIEFGRKVAAIADLSCFGLSLWFLVALGIVALGQLVLQRTVFGRYVVAVGTNEEAVRLSGIDPRPVKFTVFTLCGFLTGVAAVMYAFHIPSASASRGHNFELEAIAAVVIGGTSLMGGRGSVVASLLGVLIMAVLLSGLSALGVPEDYKRVVTGFAIVAAVVGDYYRRRMAAGAEDR
ncbi:MAG: ABC transporter permease [Planctomycetes bacterium]|nr:ABC transporter permease [Planctomycetota bacterium]